MQYELVLPTTGRSKKNIIHDHDRLEAAAEWIVEGRDVNEVTAELFERHGLTPPKHGAQAFSAFMAKIKRLVAKGDQGTIAKCQELGFDVRVLGAVEDDEASSDEDAAEGDDE